MTFYLLGRYMKKLIGYIFIFLMLTACSEQQKTQVQETAKLVKTMTVSSSNSNSIRSFPGVVEPNNNAVLSFKVAGTLSQLPLTPGMELSQGALIAKLDQQDFDINLERSASSYDLARSQLSRMKELDKKNIVSKANLDQAQAAFKTAEANYNASKNALKYTEIFAPFDLTVAEVHVENFEQVSPTQPIATVHDFTSYNISIQVPQNIMARAKETADDYQPEVSFDAYPNKIYLASLKEWGTNKESASDTYKVIFSLPNPEELNLLPGMTAEVKMDLQKITNTETSHITIPLTALFSQKGDNENNGSVWVGTNSMTLEKREVHLGRLNGNDSEVTSGINEGEKIVTAGVNLLSVGMKIKEWTQERGL